MSKKLYTTLLLAPLFFVACNQQATTPAPQETKATAPTTKQVKTKDAVPTDAETYQISFVEKPLIKEQGLMHIDSFIGSLKPTLKSALESDKTHITAAGVCSSMAMDMTNEYNAQLTDTKIRRTALKYRNSKNKPDQTDIMAMEAMKSKGDFKPIVVEMDKNHYRVYKPLPTKKPCLICHADTSKISPKVLETIKRDYPNDLATGFIEGEFRGAVVAEIQK